MKGLDLGKNEKVCAFTGHRDLGTDFQAEDLYQAILAQLNGGTYTFLNGLARGFDLLAAEFVLSLKEEYPQIRLIACIPCDNQAKYYSEEDHARYRFIRDVCENVVLYERYFNGCMQIRDRLMVENADTLIAYCRKTTGGTAYTVRCFQELHPEGKIIFL